MRRSAHGMVDKRHDTLQYGDIKFTFSCQLGAVIGIYQLETVMCWNARVFGQFISVDRSNKINK